MSSVFLCLFLITGTSNFELYLDQQINFSIFIFFPILGVLCFLATLAETNRPPFDLSEAESDVVAGYSVEYSGVLFGLFYLGEYVNIFTNAFIMTILFIGCGYDFFSQFSFLFNLILNFVFSSFEVSNSLDFSYITFHQYYLERRFERRFDEYFFRWVLFFLSLVFMFFRY
jgi:NADH:ubiquinone oxidoreductase subunit H